MPRFAAAAALAALTLLTSPLAPARAADWPTRPVRLIVSYPAGGSADAIVRPFSEALGRRFGQPFVVENRAGAAGALGTEAAARAAPDGYTFLAGPNGPIVLLPHLRKLPYVPKDLQPVAALGEFVYGFAVLPSLGPKTLGELVAAAKAKPGTISYSSPGAGSATNLRGEALKLLAGIDLIHVPYRTGAEALVDFLGGTVNVILDNVQFPHVKAGKAVLLAVTTNKRHPDFPDVPTMAEAGYPVDLPSWSAIYAPKGTPQPIIETLGAAVRELSADPEMQARILAIGFFPVGMTPTELGQNLDHAVEAYGDWVKKTGLKIE